MKAFNSNADSPMSTLGMPSLQGFGGLQSLTSPNGKEVGLQGTYGHGLQSLTSPNGKKVSLQGFPHGLQSLTSPNGKKVSLQGLISPTVFNPSRRRMVRRSVTVCRVVVIIYVDYA
jgi:hypothetical protein